MTDTAARPTAWVRLTVPADKLWGAQTQRSLEHFSIGHDLMPREMITAYAILKRSAAIANHNGKRLDGAARDLIVKVCDEASGGAASRHVPAACVDDRSGTQFNMNVNEVISNRCCQLAGTDLGSKTPVHPNDHVNMSQSSNDSFPTAMHIAAAVGGDQPAHACRCSAAGRHGCQGHGMERHRQDRPHPHAGRDAAHPGQEWSGYVGMLDDDLERLTDALKGVYKLALGGTAVGTGINAARDLPRPRRRRSQPSRILPFVSAPNKFTVQGAHDALVQLSGHAADARRIALQDRHDIRLMSCGPRAGFAELMIPENEPGSSIMPGKVNPTQAEALTMLAVLVMANDVVASASGVPAAISR